MCLAIPGKILEIYDDNSMVMGRVDFSGAISTVCLEYIDNAQVGQFVIVHAGFAISALDEEQAACSLGTWDDMIEKSKTDPNYKLEWQNSKK